MSNMNDEDERAAAWLGGMLFFGGKPPELPFPCNDVPPEVLRRLRRDGAIRLAFDDGRRFVVTINTVHVASGNHCEVRIEELL